MDTKIPVYARATDTKEHAQVPRGPSRSKLAEAKLKLGQPDTRRYSADPPPMEHNRCMLAAYLRKKAQQSVKHPLRNTIWLPPARLLPSPLLCLATSYQYGNPRTGNTTIIGFEKVNVPNFLILTSKLRRQPKSKPYEKSVVIKRWSTDL